MDNMQTLIKNYLEYCGKQKCLDEKTLKAYKIDLKQFSDYLCSSDFTDVSTSILEDYIGELHNKYKPKTVKRKIASAKAFFHYLMKALEAPLYHIAANAGLEGSVIINKVRESEVGVGFDALKEEYVDMVSAGILDPAKVTRSALQNATSVASTLLTTESVVANIKEETPAMPAGGAGMGGMM